MHDLIEQMGKNIVFFESPENPGKRSRLWSLDDVNDVLAKNKGTEAIQAIVLDLPPRYETIEGIALDLPQGYEACLHSDAFSKTSQLKLLKLCKMQISHDLNCLPSALRVLDWIQCPLKSLPLTIELDELVDLKLCHSKLKQLWKGEKFLGSLKFMDASFSKNLIRLPDISGVPNLERLVLEENLKDMKDLKKLIASETAIEEVPLCILDLENLEELSFQGCKGLVSKPRNRLMPLRSSPVPKGFSLPHSFSKFFSLHTLNLSYCNISEGSIPSDIGCLSLLMSLDLSGNNFTSLPSSISELSMLIYLHLNCCKRLQSLPELPLQTMVLEARDCTSLEIFKSNSSKQSSIIPWHEKWSFNEFDNDAYSSFHLEKSYVITSRVCKSGLCSKQRILKENIFQELDYPIPKFQMLTPGDKIPSWFETQKSSSLSKLQLQVPHNKPLTEWVGIAFCCVLVDRSYPPNLYCGYNFEVSYDTGNGPIAISFSWDRKPCTEPSLPHLAILYESATAFHDKICRYRDSSQIEFRFKKGCLDKGLEIMGCGGRLVYQHDFEDLSKTFCSMKQ
ncbi:hypothetical protein L6164_016880 [Bauhinia variegata]|uniref:Uncharacterized protein n=1 Tax=Bauhinia variegata TaxID=167791 RepID=A0ACB9N5V5_BAUVA|nr:hypothetical protein L6164_016880 [Bauhinia variegata]